MPGFPNWLAEPVRGTNASLRLCSAVPMVTRTVSLQRSACLGSLRTGAFIFGLVQNLPDSPADSQDTAGGQRHVTDLGIFPQVNGASEVNAVEPGSGLLCPDPFRVIGHDDIAV